MNKGFSTILAVTIVGAIALVVVLSLSLTILSSGRVAETFYSSFNSKALADACAEQGLMEIRKDINFSGTGNLSLEGNSCSYTVIDTGGTTREIQVTAIIDNNIRKVKVGVSQLNPIILLDYWKEVAEF